MRYIALLAALAAALMLPPPAAAAADWAWPVRGDVITPYKNGDDPYASGQHRGIDIAAPAGTQVSAAVGGRVTYAGVVGSSGLTVNVRTGDGRYDVSYLHLSAASVHEGDGVGLGDPIGAVGTSGTRSAVQPHLHLGVREAGDRTAYRDPLDFLPPPPASSAPERPTPVPVASPDPVAAPPAAAPALERAPEAVSTDALAPLPAGPAVVALGDSAAPAPAPAARASTSLTSPSHPIARPAPSGAPARRGAVPRHPVRASAAPRPQTPHASHHGGSGADRAGITRADLASPSPAAGAPPAPRPTRTVRPARRSSVQPSGDSLDIGWMTAVVGLVTAAVCLGRPETTRRAVRSSRSAVDALLRPLAGRG